MTTTDEPDVLDSVTEEEFVDPGVRPILRNGGEAFGKITSTLQEGPEAHVLRLRATFKPTLLFGVLGTKGWSHWIEHGKGEDWIIWFYGAGDVQSCRRFHPRNIFES